MVISKPMSEHIAAQSLRQAGYREYLPMEQRILRGHRDSKGTPKLYPLFPRYLFVELHPEQKWWPIKSANGVQRIIMNGERPAIMRAGIVDAIRNAENAGDFNERRETLKPGQTVRVDNGPFADFIGDIISASPNGRVRAMLSVLGGRRIVELNANVLSVVSA